MLHIIEIENITISVTCSARVINEAKANDYMGKLYIELVYVVNTALFHVSSWLLAVLWADTHMHSNFVDKSDFKKLSMYIASSLLDIFTMKTL